MSRTLTAADRSALIRLASSMGKGSPERKAIAGLKKQAARMEPEGAKALKKVRAMIQRMKRSLTRAAKTKGVYENFGVKEIFKLESEFPPWRVNDYRANQLIQSEIKAFKDWTDSPALIRLASSMEKGSDERRAILAGLSKTAEDYVEFNNSLKKLLKGLKRDTGAKKIKQNYKGKGTRSARSQQVVEWEKATLGIWPDMGFVTLTGPRTSRGVYDDDGKWLKTDRTPPTPAKIDYGNKTPEAIYKEILAALKKWLP